MDGEGVGSLFSRNESPSLSSSVAEPSLSSELSSGEAGSDESPSVVFFGPVAAGVLVTLASFLGVGTAADAFSGAGESESSEFIKSLNKLIF